MAKHPPEMNHIEAQRLSGVFDVDYFGGRKVETMPERKLTAQEWEQKLRDEEKTQRKGRTRQAREEIETEAEPIRHASRYGSFSGANVVESDVGENKTVATSGYEVEVTEAQKQAMHQQGLNVEHLETGKKIKVAKIKWS